MNRKVVFLIGTLSNGGAERVVSNISTYLPKNIEKEIVLFGDNAKIDYKYEGTITYLDKASVAGPLSKLVVLVSRIKKIRKIKRENPSVPIISFLEYPNLLNVLSGYNKSSILSVRNFMSTKHNKGLKAFFWNFTIKFFYKKASEVIVVSNQMKVDLIKNYKIPSYKIRVIYNSYPIADIKRQTYEELINKEQKIFMNPTIVTAGRLNEQKGHCHLLNIFKKVKDFNPQSQMVFLGEGNLELKLRKQAKELKLEDSVHFFGFQKNPFKFIANSDVFVMTSYYEGFPNALAEAMACKVPVISTDCLSGPREILSPKEKEGTIDYQNNEKRFGVLVPPFDNTNNEYVENKILDEIVSFINNKEKSQIYSEKAYERIKDFDIKKVIKEWEDVIQRKL